MQSHLISRRSLIKSSLFGLACSAAPAIRAAEKDEWSETYDVVIIGSGFAGLAAAYSALENGVKSVLVLEKMNVFGAIPALTADRFLEAVFKRVRALRTARSLWKRICCE